MARVSGLSLYYANRRQIAPALALVIETLSYSENVEDCASKVR